jgi:metallo-beta-lactamase family protein
MQKGEKMRLILQTESNEVTGSCHIITIERYGEKPIKILVDCGSFQGVNKEQKNKFFGFNPSEIDMVFVTHAHIDHIGRLPQLVQNGFRGPIYSGTKTWRRAQISLGRRNYNVFSQWIPVEEELLYMTLPEIEFVFFRNAHTVGSTALLIMLKNTNEKILFTGDYIGKSVFTQTYIPEWVYDLTSTIVAEATYGKDVKKQYGVFERELGKWMESSDHTAVIPVYAQERGQTVLLKIANMQKKGKISDKIPIFLQGESLGDYTQQYVEEGLLEYPHNTWTVDNNFQISKFPTWKIVLTTPGMGHGGASAMWLEHAKKDKKIKIFKVGYANADTPMGRLKKLKLNFCETNEFGSHCTGNEMIEFLSRFRCVKDLILVHGDSDTRELLKKTIQEKGIADKIWVLSPEQFLWKDLC